MDPNMIQQPVPPKKKMAVAIRKREDKFEVAVIENGEVQGVIIAKEMSELIPVLFGPLEAVAVGSHLLYDITVR